MKRLAIFMCAITFLVGVNVSDGDSRTIQHRPSVPKSVTVPAYYSQLKIALPSSGIALGQYEWVSGDIDTVETAAGLHVSHYDHDRGHWGFGYDGSGNPHLDVTQANAAWNAGHAIVVQAFNTYAGADSEHPIGFTVDKLLRGQYDAALHTFALELKAFGKPMFFQIGRDLIARPGSIKIYDPVRW